VNFAALTDRLRALIYPDLVNSALAPLASAQSRLIAARDTLRARAVRANALGKELKAQAARQFARAADSLDDADRAVRIEARIKELLS